MQEVERRNPKTAGGGFGREGDFPMFAPRLTTGLQRSRRASVEPAAGPGCPRLLVLPLLPAAGMPSTLTWLTPSVSLQPTERQSLGPWGSCFTFAFGTEHHGSHVPLPECNSFEFSGLSYGTENQPLLCSRTFHGSPVPSWSWSASAYTSQMGPTLS